MAAKEDAFEFVRYVLSQICDDTSAIELESKDDERGTLISISVSKEDMGKLIGKSGQTIDALRLLVRTIGARDGAKINLKVLDPME